MEKEEALGRIFDAITVIGRLQGLKSITRLEDTASVYRGFLRKSRYYSRLEFGQLARILEKLDVEPRDFFERAFRDSWAKKDPVRDFGYLCDLHLGKHSDGLEMTTLIWQEEASFASHGSNQCDGLEQAEKLCYSAPRSAAQKAKKLYHLAVEQGQLSLAVKATAAWSSALRFTGQLQRAQALLWRAILVVRERLPHRDWRILYADLLRRAIHLAIELGQQNLAIGLAEQAIAESGLAGDPTGIGRGLVSRGTAAAMAEKRQMALESFEAALKIFDQHIEPDPVYRLAAWFALAVETFEDGQLARAGEYFQFLSKTFPEVEANPHIWGRLRWYEGRLAHRLGACSEAEECYEEAFGILRSFVTDSVIVCVEAILLADEWENPVVRRKWIQNLREISFGLNERDHQLDRAIDSVVRESRFQKLRKETVDNIKAQFEQRWA